MGILAREHHADVAGIAVLDSLFNAPCAGHQSDSKYFQPTLLSGFPLFSLVLFPFHLTTYDSSHLQSTNNSALQCLNLICATQLAACVNIADCICVLTCPDCSCEWDTSNAASLEALAVCAQNATCVLSNNSPYTAPGSHNMSFQVTNPLGEISNSSIPMVTQDIITGLGIVPPTSIVSFGTTINFTSSILHGTNVTYAWAASNGLMGAGSLFAWNATAEGFHTVTFTLVATINVSQAVTTATLVVDLPIAVQSVSCPRYIARYTAFTCGATVSDMFQVNLTWAVPVTSAFGLLNPTFNFSTLNTFAISAFAANYFSSSNTATVTTEDPITTVTVTAPTVYHQLYDPGAGE